MGRRPPGAPSRVLWRGARLTLGRFEAIPNDDNFSTAGPIGPWPEIAFPRTPVMIRQEGTAPFVADSTLMVLYNAHQPYRREAVVADGDRCEWLAVEPDLLLEVLSPTGSGERPFRASHAALDARACMAVQLVSRHAAAGEIVPLWIEESLLHLLAACFGSLGERHALAGSRPKRMEWVHETKRVCGARFTEELTLTDIAACLGISAFHLCRLFLAETGYSLHAYVVELRLRASIERLADGADGLTGIALDLGFSSHSHFTAVFNRRFGLTPSQFRAALKHRCPPLPPSH